MNTRKIQRLIQLSKQVISDCVLENGAIVAANCSKKYFPKEAKHYMYVWPRDASFACVAADMLGMKTLPEQFFDWCMQRAEGFSSTGLFLQSYFVNGLKAAADFQPDQNGSVLWALWYHYRNRPKKAAKHEALVKKAADGLCSKWSLNHFTDVTNDLWEERRTFPDLQDNFTYTLAACIKGLESANALLPNKRWIKTAKQMRQRLSKHFSQYFVRSYGKLVDARIDASMAGLVYPFEILKPDDGRIVATVKEIENRIVVAGGVHRYENDDYDGWMFENIHRRKGGGAWPLLNFWMSICQARLGARDQALQYYNWVVERVDDFIPEQMFENNLQVSVKPLCWSHAMFIIASKELGFL